MASILLSMLAFVVALGVLITVHEFGHFWVARRFGVDVLRFSVGFGTPIWRYQKTPDSTEYVIGTIPLGGYVKMLDEREAEVPADRLQYAFNRKSLFARISVVLAGPMANFIFAILTYWLIFMLGMPGTAPVVGTVYQDTIASEAGFKSGDKIASIDGVQTPTWQSVTTEFIANAISGEQSSVIVETDGGQKIDRLVDLSKASKFVDEGVVFMQAVGFSQWPENLPATLKLVQPGYPAHTAGLRENDTIVTVNGVKVDTWQAFVKAIGENGTDEMAIEYEREGQILLTRVKPVILDNDASQTPRIGVQTEFPKSLFLTWRAGPIEGFSRALAHTWKMSVSTLTMLGKMLIGDASIKNISGPLKIAEVAGDSASAGYIAYIQFLALISISLGVLNLLPIPVLDGGHLLFYLTELITRRPVSEKVQIAGQQVGIILLIMLMGVAFFNDITGILAKFE